MKTNRDRNGKLEAKGQEIGKNLGLEKAINMAKQSGDKEKQQNTLRSDASGVKQMEVSSVDKVFKGRQQKEKPRFSKSKSNGAKPHSCKSKNPKSPNCYKCGSMPQPKHECPANDAKCHYCEKKGHNQCVFLAGKAVCVIEEDKSLFLRSVTSDADPWTAKIDIMAQNISFKLDIGVFKQHFSKHSSLFSRKLRNLCVGVRYTAAKDKQIVEKVCMVKNLSTPWLRLLAYSFGVDSIYI